MKDMRTVLASDEGAILERAMTGNNRTWSVEAARAIISFRLTEADRQRADDLAKKARDGELTDSEKSILENYLRVGRIVELMKAKALLSLNEKASAA